VLWPLHRMAHQLRPLPETRGGFDMGARRRPSRELYHSQRNKNALSPGGKLGEQKSTKRGVRDQGQGRRGHVGED
jgi:hypothetical protein